MQMEGWGRQGLPSFQPKAFWAAPSSKAAPSACPSPACHGSTLGERKSPPTASLGLNRTEPPASVYFQETQEQVSPAGNWAGEAGTCRLCFQARVINSRRQ